MKIKLKVTCEGINDNWSEDVTESISKKNYQAYKDGTLDSEVKSALDSLAFELSGFQWWLEKEEDKE